jgi:hypothetical protein
MTMPHLLSVLFIAAVTAGCERSEPVPPAEVAEATVPHGDHNPHHGGVVMMNGDLHYEVVLDPAGRYRLYFTDAVRTDLPAATATHAAVTIQRTGEPPEIVTLQIDEAGESWIGQGKAVKDPGKTNVRVAYTIKGAQPYWIDLAFDAKPVAVPANHR